MYDKWWKANGKGDCGSDDTGDPSTNSLAINNVGGVFIVLLVGLAIAVVSALVEFIWFTRKQVSSK